MREETSTLKGWEGLSLMVFAGLYHRTTRWVGRDHWRRDRRSGPLQRSLCCAKGDAARRKLLPGSRRRLGLRRRLGHGEHLLRVHLRRDASPAPALPRRLGLAALAPFPLLLLPDLLLV